MHATVGWYRQNGSPWSDEHSSMLRQMLKRDIGAIGGVAARKFIQVLLKQREAAKGAQVMVTCLRLALVQSCERTDLMEAESGFGTSATTGVAAGAVRGATDGAAGEGER